MVFLLYEKKINNANLCQNNAQFIIQMKFKQFYFYWSRVFILLDLIILYPVNKIFFFWVLSPYLLLIPILLDRGGDLLILPIIILTFIISSSENQFPSIHYIYLVEFLQIIQSIREDYPGFTLKVLPKAFLDDYVSRFFIQSSQNIVE